MPRVAIAGGGLAGLSTAYELSRQGHTDFVLYEASPRLGGIIETHRQDGYVIECGADSWVTEKPWARELAIELGLEAEILPSEDAHRRTYLLQGDSLIPMPDGMRMMVPGDLRAIENSPLFSEEAKRAYRREPSRAEELKAFAAARPEGEDESIASFVQRHFGEEVTQKVAGPLLAGVFGGEISKLSSAAILPALLKTEREYGSLILRLQEQRRGGAAKGSVFTSLRNGLQSLIDGMAAALPAEAIRLNEPAIALVPKGGAWEVTTASGASAFDKVVIATPVHITRELVAPLHPELRELLAIEATSAVVAAFGFDSEASSRMSIPEGFGFLVPQCAPSQPSGAGPRLLAATFVHQKFSHRAPAGCALIRAFFGGDAAPELLGLADDHILALAHSNLSRVLGGFPKPKITLVRRWPRSLPQYHVGHRTRVARIESIVTEQAGLYLIGNGFHGVGIPDLIHLGRETAVALTAF